MCKNDHKEKSKEIKNVVEKIMIVIHIFFKIFCITGNAERLWLLEWLIAAVNVVFYLFNNALRQCFAVFCKLISIILSLLIFLNIHINQKT